MINVLNITKIKDCERLRNDHYKWLAKVNSLQLVKTQTLEEIKDAFLPNFNIIKLKNHVAIIDDLKQPIVESHNNKQLSLLFLTWVSSLLYRFERYNMTQMLPSINKDCIDENNSNDIRNDHNSFSNRHYRNKRKKFR